MSAQAITATQPQVNVEARTAARVRMAYVDNLRILLISLVVLLHLSIGYGASGDWYYNEKTNVSLISAVALTLFTAVNQAFFMGFFFMISSYLTPVSFDRKGAGRYFADRLKRLGIPLVFYALVINPLLDYVLALYDGFQGSFVQFVAKYSPSIFGVGPQWFVEELLIFSSVYVLWRVLTHSRPRAVSSPSLQTPGNAALALFAIALGLVTFVFRIAFPVGWWFEPLHLQLAHSPQYIAFFVVGLVAYRNNWLAQVTEAQGKLWSVVAVALVPIFLAIAVAGEALSGDLSAFEGGLHWQAAAYAIWEQFMAVAMIVSLLVLFRSRFNHQGRLARTLSDATFAVYVLHPPVIVLLAMALSVFQLDGGIKFVLVAPLALALCFAIGSAVKRLPVARDIL